MSTVRMGLVVVAFVGLVSVSVLANEPMEDKNPTIGIEAAERKALAPNEAALEKMLKAPAGVFALEYDKKGVLLRLKIKGECEATTALSGARADRLARERAQRLAKADFVKFLKEKVSVQENDQEEVIIVQKDGGEDQAGYKQVSTRKIETQAEGLLRGLIVLDEILEGEGRNRKAVIVYGWSKKLADAARTAGAEMARESNPAPRSAGSRNSNTGSSGTQRRSAENVTDF